MGDLRYQAELLDEVAHRLDLRETNRKAIESVILSTSAHYDIAGRPAPFECIVDSATGVGKTYILAGLVEYLAGAEVPARDFLLLAPGRTIRDKSERNFTPGNRRSLTAAMRSRPYLITADNFDSSATFTAMADPSITKLYVFTVQALTSATGEGRATHAFQEELGGSFFEYLAGLDDLVILADEHHCYRGRAFSRTIRELGPELVVGLTATPDPRDESLIVYRYPLAQAIHDRLVKTPVVVGRRDDRHDDETKLLDGVTLLRYKTAAAQAFSAENNLPPVNPVMLVIARSIDEAERLQAILDSEAFAGGAWIGKTLIVHSDLTGDAKEQALQALEDVESPGSPVRVIVNVAQLKEGWDVKNVYVILSFRPSVSEVLTEQTLGRGMRLPFGSYTGLEMLDTVEIIAHEKYSDLLAKRDSLNERFIDYGTVAERRVLPDGSVVVRQRPVVTEDTVIAPVADDEPAATATSDTSTPPRSSGVADLEGRTAAAAALASQTAHATKLMPLLDREPIFVPRLVTVPMPAAVSLHDIDVDDYARFDQLGQAITADHADELRRTKIVTREQQGQLVVSTETAHDVVRAAVLLDVPLEVSRKQLVHRIMKVRGVQARPLEVAAAERIVDRLIGAMGDEAATYLSAFPEVCGRRLADEVTRALAASAHGTVTYDDQVELVELNREREVRRELVDGHADGSFSRTIAFDTWRRHLYSHAWFDSEPEYKAAAAIDDGRNVVVWARLGLGDVEITWTSGGRQYNPDFVVIEDLDGSRVGWLVETKADRDMTIAEVVAKRRAARKWASIVSAATGDQWGYLLLSETDVDDAQGSWEQMKGFAQ